MDCPLTPYGEKVIIKQDMQKKTTASGIILDQTEQVEINSGVIVSVSKILKNDLFVGQRIIFRHHEPKEYTFDDITYRVIDDAKIIAILKEDDKKTKKKSNESSNTKDSKK